MMTDWYQHYRDKNGLNVPLGKIPYDQEMERPFVDFVKMHVPVGKRLLECGVGLGRGAVALRNAGFFVTGLERDPRLIATAWCLSVQHQAPIDLHLGDFFNLATIFGPDSFDAVTHQGVLEHFEPPEISDILRLELQVAPKVVFSVPIAGKDNASYFADSEHRNLWTRGHWLTHVLKGFTVLDSQVAQQRSYNLFVAVGR